MAITASGIGSGLDIESLVTQLVAAEGQTAALRLATQEADLQADLSAIGTLSSDLASFQTAVQALQDRSDFLARTASSSDDEYFTATADETAVDGSYEIEITQLAQAERLRSADFTTSESETVGTGTLDITLGSDSFSVSIDSSNQSLEGIRDAINNADDNPGVTASLIHVDSGTRLILTSDKVGAANTIDIVATDDNAGDGFDLTRLATANLTAIQQAQDAIILVDQQQVTRDSNSFSDVITGITFSLEKAEVGVTETLTVNLDDDAIQDKVSDFVSAYNKVAESIARLTAFDADTGTAGQLQGDAGVRGLQSQIRQAISDPVDGLDLATLAELGITTNDSGGLDIDEDKLSSAISGNSADIADLFTNEEQGLSNRIDSLIERYVASDGVFTARTESIEEQIEDIGDENEALELRLEVIEARYRSQFSALDSLISELNSIGSFLTTQLANLPTINSSS